MWQKTHPFRSRRAHPARPLLATIGLGVLGLLAGAGCDRNDMRNGYRTKSYEASDFFADGMSARPIVDGTVPRALPGQDIPYLGDYAGGTPAGPTAAVAAAEGDGPPEPVTMDVLLRGQQRFNIYCAVCHNATGDGRGMIVQRGFTPPPTFHQDRLRQAPMSHFVDVMSHGFGAMYSYADRVPPRDRWAVAAYIRVLQLSHDPAQHGMTAPTPPTTQPAAPAGHGGGEAAAADVSAAHP
jgi:mono/diheme cytochrome c family protein